MDTECRNEVVTLEIYLFVSKAALSHLMQCMQVISTLSLNSQN